MFNLDDLRDDLYTELEAFRFSETRHYVLAALVLAVVVLVVF